MVENKILNIIIVTSEPFPEGGAATNRIRSYAKGLKKLGHKVKVITLKPSNYKNNAVYYGKIDNYYFLNSSKKIYWSNESFFLKIIIILKGLLKAVNLILFDKNKIDHIILISNKPIYIVTFFFISRLKKIKYIQEKSEFPFVLNNKSIFGKLYANFYVNIFYKLFDAFIVMTKPLLNYLKLKSRKSASFFLMPMTVEPERFYIPSKKPINDDYIAYCGSMGGNKDGVDILINAFGIVNKKYNKIKLVLIGSAPEKDMNKLKLIISSLSLKNNVYFTGKVSRDEIPNYLINAKMLVLSRPAHLQSLGGFPTKLGEYLSTGKPVVVTKVGEIPNYLSDGVNAFLSEPDNPKAFALKMIEVLDNYPRALEISAMGRDVVKKVFDYKVQSKRLANFLINLL